jgi:hypothetical protein
MERHWECMQQTEREGMLIVVDRTYCDLDPADLFDDACWDIAEIYDKINNGIYEWFDLRAKIIVSGLEIASAHLSGFLYENPMDVFEDGTAQGLIDEALQEAQSKFYSLGRRFTALAEAAENV